MLISTAGRPWFSTCLCQAIFETAGIEAGKRGQWPDRQTIIEMSGLNRSCLLVLTSDTAQLLPSFEYRPLPAVATADQHPVGWRGAARLQGRGEAQVGPWPTEVIPLPVVPDLSLVTGLQGCLDLRGSLFQPASKRPLVMG